MTNFEWVKSLNVDEFTEWVVDVASGDVYDNVGDLKNFTTWCQEEKCHGGNCDSCIKKWLKAEHITPMPTLVNGMFVSVQVPTYETQTGVVVDDNIIYQNGTFDSIDEVKDKIIKVYNAKSFGGCLESNVIWRKL